MNTVSIPDEEYVYAISLLVKNGWTRTGDNAWVHPNGIPCEEETWDPVAGKNIIVSSHNWPTEKAYEQVKNDLEKHQVR